MSANKYVVRLTCRLVTEQRSRPLRLNKVIKGQPGYRFKYGSIDVTVKIQRAFVGVLSILCAQLCLKIPHANTVLIMYRRHMQILVLYLFIGVCSLVVCRAYRIYISIRVV
jgi:hypothetical protein